MISAVVVCFNEGENLKRCLSSVEDFADEIVVLDLGSTDESVAIYKKYNAKVFKHELVSYVEKVRDYAISKTTGEWVLVLDPDEIVSDALKRKLKQIALESRFAAVNIPRKNIFFNKWIAHTNWWPDRHIRFFKKQFVRWGDKIHGYPEVEGKIIHLEADKELAIIHFGYKSVSEFIDRQNRYSKIEAENLYLNGSRFSWGLFFWKATREFLVRLIKHAGFLDGFYGITLTFLMMIYQLTVVIKLWELEKQKR